jgi:tRNA dimethylallyltransferase
MIEKIINFVSVMDYELITILGPTASGKTAFAVALASLLDTEIISADSRQVYRGMDIGTGKDLNDYIAGSWRIPYHLIDICEAGEKYNVFRYQQDFHEVFRRIRSLHRNPPILCGGTGMYIEAVLGGFRFNDAGMPAAQQYPEIRSLIVGIDIDRSLRREKISRRLRARLDEGMIDEIRRLLDSGIKVEDLTYYGLEYKYVTLYATGRLSYDEMFRQLEIAIHQFAKRQMTWFRGMERRGFNINWIDACLPDEEKIAKISGKLL